MGHILENRFYFVRVRTMQRVTSHKMTHINDDSTAKSMRTVDVHNAFFHEHCSPHAEKDTCYSIIHHSWATGDFKCAGRKTLTYDPCPYSDADGFWQYCAGSKQELGVHLKVFHEQYSLCTKQGTTYSLICITITTVNFSWLKRKWWLWAKKGWTGDFENEWHLWNTQYHYITWHVHSISIAQLISKTDHFRILTFAFRTRPERQGIARYEQKGA